MIPLTMFSLFRQRFSCRALLPEGVDTHCHLLPGVDDGAPHAKEALEMISYMKKRGLRGCICTPHVSLRYPANSTVTLRAAFQDFCISAAEQHPDFMLQLAAEYMLDERFPHLLAQEELLYWLQPEMILVELSATHPVPGWADLLSDMLRRGYTPVLAHPERYHRHLSEQDLEHLHSLGILFQGNIGSPAGIYGRSVQKLCRRLRDAGLYFRWGSDAHRSKGFRALPLKT